MFIALDLTKLITVVLFGIYETTRIDIGMLVLKIIVFLGIYESTPIC